MSETTEHIGIDLDDFVVFLQATSKDQAREILRHVIAYAYALGREELAQELATGLTFQKVD